MGCLGPSLIPEASEKTGNKSSQNMEKKGEEYEMKGYLIPCILEENN